MTFLSCSADTWSLICSLFSLHPTSPHLLKSINFTGEPNGGDCNLWDKKMSHIFDFYSIFYPDSFHSHKHTRCVSVRAANPAYTTPAVCLSPLRLTRCVEMQWITRVRSCSHELPFTLQQHRNHKFLLWILLLWTSLLLFPQLMKTLFLWCYVGQNIQHMRRKEVNSVFFPDFLSIKCFYLLCKVVKWSNTALKQQRPAATPLSQHLSVLTFNSVSRPQKCVVSYIIE